MTVCANCKSENPAESMFCLECGTAVSSNPETSVARPLGGRSIRVVLVVAVLVVGLGAGAALALSGALEPVVGKRFTQAELDEEADASHDRGKKAGYEVGYSDGSFLAYKNGYAAGCDRVFDMAGYDQVIGIYYPYRAFNTGDYYITRSYAC